MQYKTENPNLTPIQRTERRLQNEMAQLVAQLEFLQTHRELLESLAIQPTFCLDFVDFDNLKRPDMLRVLKIFPGKWDKSPGYNGGLHYIRRERVGGFQIRIYNGEPPTSCVIEEKVEYIHVPAKVERVVTRVVRCPEPTAPANSDQI